MALMDQKEIANFLAQELFYQQFITLEGLNSGVPTRTTPTLTPTTLRNIEQTFIELQTKSESHENEAGFVPPLVHSIGNNQYIPASEVDIYSKSSSSSSLWNTTPPHSSLDIDTRPTPPVTPKNGLSNTTTEPTRRNMGGRKPVKDLNLTPEEEERRRIRRERNKMAAARCRKRRVDHTNSLLIETEGLEQKKQALKTELQELQTIKDELEYLLDSHHASQCCRLQQQNGRSNSPPDIKPYAMPQFNDKLTERVKTEYVEDTGSVINVDTDIFTLPNPAKKIMLSSTVPISKPSRPSSLNVSNSSCLNSKNNNVSEIAGIAISTPSNGMQFNFDSLMVGGTGLTPISAPLVPSCSTQQRNIPITHADITSPDTCGPPKLVSL